MPSAIAAATASVIIRRVLSDLTTILLPLSASRSVRPLRLRAKRHCKPVEHTTRRGPGNQVIPYIRGEGLPSLARWAPSSVREWRPNERATYPNEVIKAFDGCSQSDRAGPRTTNSICRSR